MFQRKENKNKENKGKPQPNPGRKKAFDEKRGQLTAAKIRKERNEKNTCRPRTTEETYKPLKILEIALAKETKTTILEGLLGAITRSPKANPEQQRIFFFKYFLA